MRMQSKILYKPQLFGSYISFAACTLERARVGQQRAAKHKMLHAWLTTGIQVRTFCRNSLNRHPSYVAQSRPLHWHSPLPSFSAAVEERIVYTQLAATCCWYALQSPARAGKIRDGSGIWSSVGVAFSVRFPPAPTTPRARPNIPRGPGRSNANGAVVSLLSAQPSAAASVSRPLACPVLLQLWTLECRTCFQRNRGIVRRSSSARSFTIINRRRNQTITNQRTILFSLLLFI
jgi:hypothetical protein